MLEERLQAVTNREKTGVTPNSVRSSLSVAEVVAVTVRIPHPAKPVVLGADRETKMTHFWEELDCSRAIPVGASVPMVAAGKEAAATTKAPVAAVVLEKQGGRTAMTTVATEATGRTSATGSGPMSASAAGLLRAAVVVAAPVVQPGARAVGVVGAMEL